MKKKMENQNLKFSIIFQIMLSALIRDHETSQQKSREKIKKLEQRTAQLAAKYAKELSIKLNEPIRRCYQNEKKCDVEIKRVEAETGKLVAINAQWKEKLDAFELALRELGDVQVGNCIKSK